MRRLVGIMMVASAGAALACNLIGPAVAQSVTPASFAKQVCAAVASADESGTAPSAALKAAAQAYKASPSATTAAALRDAMTKAVLNLDEQFTAVLTAISRSGVPANATDFVGALTSELEAQRAKAQELALHSGAIDATSSAAFVTGFQQVLDETKSAGAQARASAKGNPAFQHVARPLQPIVRLLTTKADTCKG